MQAEIKGPNLIITLPIAATPQPSKSGKTLVVATTNGNVTTSVQVQGKPLVIGLNAYIAR